MAQLIVAAEVDGGSQERLNYDSDFDSLDSEETNHSDSDDSLLPVIGITQKKASQESQPTQVGTLSAPQPTDSFLTGSNSNGNTTNPVSLNEVTCSSGVLTQKTVDEKQPSTAKLSSQSCPPSTTSRPPLGLTLPSTTSRPPLGLTLPSTTSWPPLGPTPPSTTSRPPLGPTLPSTTSWPPLGPTLPSTTSRPPLGPTPPSTASRPPLGPTPPSTTSRPPLGPTLPSTASRPPLGPTLPSTTSQPPLGTTLLSTTSRPPLGPTPLSTTSRPPLGPTLPSTTSRPPLGPTPPSTASRPPLRLTLPSTTSRPPLGPTLQQPSAPLSTASQSHTSSGITTFSPSRSSPTSSISPLKLSTGDHQKTVDETKKLFSKSRKLSKTIKEKSERRHKIEKLEKGGGIRGLAKEWKKMIPEEEGNTDTQTPSGDTPLPNTEGLLRDTNASFPLPTRPPGKSIFTSPPELISEIYPPGIDLKEGSPFATVERNLTQNNPDVLREMICGGWLKLCYEYKPCPPSIWQWLFQIVCRSDDTNLSNGAFGSLLALLQLTERRKDLKSIHLPSVSDIVDVLVYLGASQNQLLPDDEAMEVDGNDDVFAAPRPPLRNLSGLFNYLCAYVRVLPACYTMDELECLVLLFMNLSLDPTLCGQLMKRDVSLCIGALLAALPEEYWAKSANRLNVQALKISHHHHDRLYLASVISGVSQRQKFLQQIFCKECIRQELKLLRVPDETERMASTIKTEEESTSAIEEVTSAIDSQGPNAATGGLNENCLFAREVILHYQHKSSLDYDYYSMYSVLTMLTFFMHPTEMKWPSPEERKKFERLLSSVNEKIKDNPMRLERGPVKDLIIRMKLKVSSQRVAQAKQTQLLF